MFLHLFTYFFFVLYKYILHSTEYSLNYHLHFITLNIDLQMLSTQVSGKHRGMQKWIKTKCANRNMQLHCFNFLIIISDWVRAHKYIFILAEYKNHGKILRFAVIKRKKSIPLNFRFKTKHIFLYNNLYKSFSSMKSAECRVQYTCIFIFA